MTIKLSKQCFMSPISKAKSEATSSTLTGTVVGGFVAVVVCGAAIIVCVVQNAGADLRGDERRGRYGPIVFRYFRCNTRFSLLIGNGDDG